MALGEGPVNEPISPHHSDHGRRTRDGLLYGLAAYGVWGLLPIYFKALKAIPSIDIVAHRIVWSLLVLVAFLTIARDWVAVRATLANRRTMTILLTTSVLIGANWLLYVYAINSGHILAGSLGYYLNPLANILLGRFLLKEHLGRTQWLAVGIASVGVAVLAAGALGTLWISLALCFSFATYGLLRKIAAVEALPGLAIETAILAPIAIIWLAMGGAAGRPLLGPDWTENGLLIASGVVSTVPLLCFTAAARRLPYSTVGILQFIAPTVQFLLAVIVYDEPFTTAHAIAFGCIWTALFLYVGALLTRRNALAS